MFIIADILKFIFKLPIHINPVECSFSIRRAICCMFRGYSRIGFTEKMFNLQVEIP